jgi:hypothetical protein
VFGGTTTRASGTAEDEEVPWRQRQVFWLLEIVPHSPELVSEVQDYTALQCPSW